jgi:hypothetical protein
MRGAALGLGIAGGALGLIVPVIERFIGEVGQPCTPRRRARSAVSPGWPCSLGWWGSSAGR